MICVHSRLFAACILTVSLLPAARLKDLAAVDGVRDNMLVGYGIVVGLKGTGDRQQTVFSTQTLANLLDKMGITVSPTAIRVNNIAAVMITATLPPYADPGSRLDVLVNSIGDASSLQGGTLLLTPLKAATGEVYAAAQGPISIGGFSAGNAQAGVQLNHPTVGRTEIGALVKSREQRHLHRRVLLGGSQFPPVGALPRFNHGARQEHRQREGRLAVRADLKNVLVPARSRPVALPVAFIVVLIDVSGLRGVGLLPAHRRRTAQRRWRRRTPPEQSLEHYWPQ